MHSSLVVAARRRALCNGPRREKKSLYDRSGGAFKRLSHPPFYAEDETRRPAQTPSQIEQYWHQQLYHPHKNLLRLPPQELSEE